MTKSGPKFSKPPVIETVMGVQFAPLVGFTSAHVGRFWQEYLKDWPKTTEAARLDDAIEEFPSPPRLLTMFGLRPSDDPNRVQIIEESDERMVQIQNTRFILNWRKRGKDYPGYDALVQQFQKHLGDFRQFVEQLGMGQLELNQWEVTYVNNFEKGALWNTPADWPKVIPGLYIPKAESPAGASFESTNAEWRHVIGNNQGRLYTLLRHGRMLTSNVDFMQLQFITRGPITGSSSDEIAACLGVGHDAIVETFASITDRTLQRNVWERIS